MLARSTWPEYDPAKCVDDTVEMVVQVCGKIKARITVAISATTLFPPHAMRLEYIPLEVEG